MSNFLKIVIIFAAGFFLTSCNTNTKSDPYYKISSQFKQYCVFQKQSKWTYENDQDNNLHDLIIKNVNDYIGFHAGDNQSGPYSFDVVDMFYDTTNSLHIHKVSINAGNPTTGSGDMNGLYWLFFSDQNYLLAFAPGYPMGVEQRLGSKPGLYTNIEKLNSYTVNGKDYTDVYHTQVRKTEGTPDTVNYQFYFAPHYGLIKWTRRVNGKTTSFSLAHANLIQQ